MVEITLAVHGRFRILVLDKPTTALSARATEGLFALLRTLRAEGVALIYISHQITEVSAVADRVTVPREGASAGTLTRDELSVQAVVRMQVGPQPSSVIDRVDGCKKARGERSAETAVWLHAVIERHVTAMTKGRVAKIMCAPDGHGPWSCPEGV